MKRTILMLAFVLCGCAKPDPVKELRTAMESFANRHTNAVNFAFDVRQTDSLVSPYMGKVSYTYPGDTNHFDDNYNATFARQEGKWTLKELCYTTSADHVDRVPYEKSDPDLAAVALAPQTFCEAEMVADDRINRSTLGNHGVGAGGAGNLFTRHRNGSLWLE